ncbi:ABC transporter ATP-binding protein [Streptomyces sp. NPDC099050]|uniref:ABC transporter ATP-binding protein n=1 Tax=Streptomyces sp. NPDC099050 TaxID=3366100 RepID=UPI0037F8F7F6
MKALPVASADDAKTYARQLVWRHPRDLAFGLLLHAAAAVCGLVGPWVVGELVEDVNRGVDHVVRDTAVIAASVLAQAVLIRYAMYVSARLSEKVLAELREEFVENVLALPLTTVEQAGTGDLVTRTTRDVDVLSRAARQAVPDTLIAGITIAMTLGALALLDPLLVLPCFVAVPVLAVATRWYLARARDGYLRQSASYSQIIDGLTETVEGARTVDAFDLRRRRLDRADRDITESYAAERYTLRLRSVYLPVSDVAYSLPVVATVICGGIFYINDWVTLAAATAATLYVQQLLEPVDRLLFWMDELQVGSASLARLLGVRGQPLTHHPAQAASDGDAAPANAPGAGAVVSGVRYAYRPGHDVLRGVDLHIRAGERLAIVGPSGAGKSTLGRLLAGIHTADSGSVTLAGRVSSGLSPTERRRRIALVTQEHHVFRGTLRENLSMADPDADDGELESALRAVDAWEWAAAMGLDAETGAPGNELSPARAQQLALARIVLLDPQILVLDEATSLLTPGAARRLERSLAAVLEGRTVVAIAHRLHTAHDADRVAVMEDGAIRELGSHDELLRLDGVYAALWRSWNVGTTNAHED